MKPGLGYCVVTKSLVEVVCICVFLSPPLPITGAIVGMDQSSYEIGEGDGSFTVCVILYDGVLALDTDVHLNVRRRQGGTAGI